jgi:enoyl-CoA hydratase/carnithine racemase
VARPVGPHLNAAWDRFRDDTDAWVGILTATGDTFSAIRLPHRVGWANAMELLLTGQRMSAERAKEIGLVWKLVEPDEVASEAMAWAKVLTEAAPLAQRATKEVAWRTADMSWIESVRFGETMRKVAAATEDAAEGGRARLEKREPNWQGR